MRLAHPPTPRRPSRVAPGVWTALFLGLVPAPLVGQVNSGFCPAAVVERIEIRNHSLFRPSDIDDHPFEWALSFANWVRIRTREHFLRRELFIQEGDCYDPERVSESERFIRDLDFIARVEIESETTEASGRVLRVETWDEWSTQVGIDFHVEGAFNFKGFFVEEKNLFGRGLRLGFRYRDFREEKSQGLTLSSNRFLGSRANATLGAGTTRTGHFVRQNFAYPFLGESSRWSWESRIQFADQAYTYLTGNPEGVSHVLLPFPEWSGHSAVRRRVGRPGALTVFGAEATLLRREEGDPARQVIRGNFEESVTASDSLARPLLTQNPADSYLQVGATVGLRRLSFTTGRGLDRVTGVQNVALGSELLMTVGRSLSTFGTSSGYTWGRLEGFLSGSSGPLLANTSFDLSARRRDEASTGETPWRDISLRGLGLLYIQPGNDALHTTVTGVEVEWHAHVDRLHQTVLGGEQGVRSYRDDAVPVGSLVAAFLEHRVNLTLFAPAVDLGLTIFGDVGRGWAGDVPFAQDTGWRAAVGGGIRFGFPAGTGSVSHIELAWPVGGSGADRGPVLRTYWAPARTSR